MYAPALPSRTREELVPVLADVDLDRDLLAPGGGHHAAAEDRSGLAGERKGPLELGDDGQVVRGVHCAHRRRMPGPGRHHGEAGPGAEQAEGALELGPGDRGGAARADHDGRDDPRRRAAPGDPDPEQLALDQAADVLGGGGQAELTRPPVIGVAAGAVVGVVHAPQPGGGARPGPGVLDVLGVPAGAREEVGDDRRAVVGHDLARGGGDRGIGGRGLGRHAPSTSASACPNTGCRRCRRRRW